MRKRNIIYVIFCLWTLISYGQSSNNQSFSIGGESDPDYGLTIHNARGINMYGRSLFFVDVEHTLCYMRGSGWGVYFYDTDTQTYNDICAQMVLQNANGEIYDSWIGDDGDVSILRQLNPVSYNFRSSDSSREKSVCVAGENSRHIGFLAQEVETVIPAAVTTDDKGRKCVDYDVILPVAVKSIRAIAKKSDANRKRLDEIRSAVGSLTINNAAK